MGSVTQDDLDKALMFVTIPPSAPLRLAHEFAALRLAHVTLESENSAYRSRIVTQENENKFLTETLVKAHIALTKSSLTADERALDATTVLSRAMGRT